MSELLPAERPAMSDLGILSHYSALPHSEGAGMMTTLDLTQRANIIALNHALNGESESLWDLPPDQVIRVTDLIAHYGERTNEDTGELVKGPMLTLLGPDGIYHTGSQYAFRALQMIALTDGRPPWHPPKAIRAVRNRSRNKRNYQSIILVE